MTTLAGRQLASLVHRAHTLEERVQRRARGHDLESGTGLHADQKVCEGLLVLQLRLCAQQRLVVVGRARPLVACGSGVRVRVGRSRMQEGQDVNSEAV